MEIIIINEYRSNSCRFTTRKLMRNLKEAKRKREKRKQKKRLKWKKKIRIK